MTNISRKSRKFSEDILKEKISGFTQVDIAVPNELYDKFSGMVLLLVAQGIPDSNLPEKIRMYKANAGKKKQSKEPKS